MNGPDRTRPRFGRNAGPANAAATAACGHELRARTVARMPKTSPQTKMLFPSLLQHVPALPSVCDLTLFELKISGQEDDSRHPWPTDDAGWATAHFTTVTIGYVDGPPARQVKQQLTHDLAGVYGSTEGLLVYVNRTYSLRAQAALLLQQPPGPRVKRLYSYLEPLLDRADLTALPPELLTQAEDRLRSCPGNRNYGLHYDEIFAHVLGRT